MPERTPRRGILGGTFDPPHLGHLTLAASARLALALDEVWFLPAGDPYRKSGSVSISSAENRLQMLTAAIAALPWARLSTVELERDGPTYTAETLRALVAPGEKWWFILGSDALADLPHWREPEAIVEQVRLAWAKRSGGTEDSTLARTVASVPALASRIDEIEMPLLEIGSTALRDRIRARRPTESLLPPAVRQVIDELGLYR